MADNILLKINDRVAIVTIKLNALDAETVTQLFQVFKKLRQNEEVRVIVLTGSGEKAFVAGADISQIHRHDDISGRIFAMRGQKVFRYIQKMPKPVIAAINGYALGAGLELSLFCHLKIASENAQFGQPEIGLGLIPGYGGTQQLPRAIGSARALYLLLTGERIHADKALQLGLVNEVVPAEKLMPRATELAERLSKNPTLATKAILQAVTEGLDTHLDSGLNLEAELFGNLCITEDMKEGTSAFLEKRKPEFKGK